jgi:peptidoglycan/LPS O-acetylase OafA/YrhL
MTASKRAVSSERYGEIDLLKAVSILVVPLIHSVRFFLDPGLSSMERWLLHVTQFAVPGFLFCSGFLQASASGGAEVAQTRRRLRRLLLPYLLASVIALLWRTWREGGLGPVAWVRDLAFGAAFGPYYYIFVIVALTLAAPLIRRCSERQLWILFWSMLPLQWVLVNVLAGHVVPLFWHVRNPLSWTSYFLLGWLLALRRVEVSEWIAQYRIPACSGLAGLVLAGAVIAWWELPEIWGRTADLVLIYAVLALLYIASQGRRLDSPPVRYLSDASYSIYLYHLFFIEMTKPWVTAPAGEFRFAAVALPWGAALLGPIVVISLGRALLGSRSRNWLGA